jgi:hypothetical protein
MLFTTSVQIRLTRAAPAPCRVSVAELDFPPRFPWLSTREEVQRGGIEEIASSLRAEFQSIRVSWVPRQMNAEADDSLGMLSAPLTSRQSQGGWLPSLLPYDDVHDDRGMVAQPREPRLVALVRDGAEVRERQLVERPHESGGRLVPHLRRMHEKGVEVGEALRVACPAHFSP